MPSTPQDPPVMIRWNVPNYDFKKVDDSPKGGCHTWYKCPPTCENQYCQFCQGGLQGCTVCGGFEGSLPTQCPGRKMTEEEEKLVYAHHIDFNRNMWWVAKELLS